MKYVQFSQKSAISEDIIEATGDRSVVILDGRERAATHFQIATQECIKRGYVGWAFFSGESFTQGRVMSSFYALRDGQSVATFAPNCHPRD